MISDYARIIKEKQFEEELKWLEVEYVQRTTNSLTKRKKPRVFNKRQRDKDQVFKS
jgi:hypothetical protein